jgi:hypothetical protein
MFRGIISVDCGNHTKHVNTAHCVRKMQNFLMLKQVVSVVTALLEIFDLTVLMSLSKCSYEDRKKS